MVGTTTSFDGLREPIPLQVLFGNADKGMPRISPDGKYFAYLADNAQGVTNVIVEPVPLGATTDVHKSLTHHRILYVQDTGGDENFHLYAAEFELDDNHTARNIVTRDVTPFGAVTVSVHSIQLSSKLPDVAIISLNKRDARLFDAYKVDLASGEVEMLVENPGDVMTWRVDADLNVVAAVAADSTDSSVMLCVPTSPANKNAPSEWKTIVRWPYGETARVLAATNDGNAVYVETTLLHGSLDANASTNTSRFVLLSLEDGHEIHVIVQDPQCDVSSIHFNDEEHTVEHVVFNYTKPRIVVIDETVRDDTERLVALSKGTFSLVSASRDNQIWLFSDGPDNASLKHYIYDRATKQHMLLFDSRPELTKYTLTTMEPHVIKTSDGEDMVVS